jgi:hypothetical protein
MNSMEAYCFELKVNIDNNGPLQYYFLCEDNSCKIENRTCVSLIRNQKCICGKILKKEKPMQYYFTKEIGFVKETSTFIVSDDLTLEKETLNISKLSLVSIVSDVIFSVYYYCYYYYILFSL